MRAALWSLRGAVLIIMEIYAWSWAVSIKKKGDGMTKDWVEMWLVVIRHATERVSGQLMRNQ